MTQCEENQQVGGEFRYVWVGPDNMQMAMHGKYLEVVAPERIVRTESFDLGCAPQAGEQHCTLTLKEIGLKTLLRIIVKYPSKEARDATIASGMEKGIAASYDRLEGMICTKGFRKPGQFCWINMLTPQPDEARDFFGKVLQWTFFEMPGVGHGIRVAGKNIGGIFDIHSPQTPPGTPPHIGVMVKVENADAIKDRVNELGGKAQTPFDVFDAGRMVVCQDPAGGRFDVWEPKKMQGTEVDANEIGAPSWFELMSNETVVAAKFYSDLFGWTSEAVQGGPIPYTVFRQEAVAVAGMLQITPEMGSMPSNWATYFTVKNLDECQSLARELGGNICMTTKQAPGVGRFCGLVSPQGVYFYMMEFEHA
jgi:predicted enzyme related to lactoylglutathione lyase/uncharacterized protein YndB with AHSA1/START domain